MDPRSLGVAYRSPGGVDVLGMSARQPGDDRALDLRAIASTASKSPGEVIGKPASMTSTPRRASCWAISSFSAVFSETPGDCSPSRSVVSKMTTRSESVVLMSLPFSSLGLGPAASSVGLRLRGRHALFPPRGEEKKQEVETKLRHAFGEPSSGSVADARDRTTAPVARAPAASTSMSIFARAVRGIVSVGLNAVELVNARYR